MADRRFGRDDTDRDNGGSISPSFFTFIASEPNRSHHHLRRDKDEANAGVNSVNSVDIAPLQFSMHGAQ